jgi:hypothetical protein
MHALFKFHREHKNKLGWVGWGISIWKVKVHKHFKNNKLQSIQSKTELDLPWCLKFTSPPMGWLKQGWEDVINLYVRQRTEFANHIFRALFCQNSK